jgi:hypothetical protein
VSSYGEIFRSAGDRYDAATRTGGDGWSTCNHRPGDPIPVWADDEVQVQKCWARINYFIESQHRRFYEEHVTEIEKQWPVRDVHVLPFILKLFALRFISGMFCSAGRDSRQLSKRR